MKRFVLNILLFSCLMAAGLAVCECLTRRVPDSTAYQYRYVEQHGEGISTLILGPSTSFWGIDPQYFPTDSVFNISANGQPLRNTLRTLQRYGHEMPNLHTVVIGLVVSSLFDYPQEELKTWPSEIPPKIYTRISDHSDFSRYNFYLSFPPQMRKRLLPWYTDTTEQFDSLGHSTASRAADRPSRWRESFRWAKAYHVPKDWKYLNTNISYLDSILTLCRNKGIKAVLVNLPYTHEVTKELPPAQTGMYYAVIRAMQKKHGISYLDYGDDPRIPEEAFYDPIHLSTDTGAAIFTPILASDLQKLP